VTISPSPYSHRTTHRTHRTTVTVISLHSKLKTVLHWTVLAFVLSDCILHCKFSRCVHIAKSVVISRCNFTVLTVPLTVFVVCSHCIYSRSHRCNVTTLSADTTLWQKHCRSCYMPLLVLSANKLSRDLVLINKSYDTSSSAASRPIIQLGTIS
jgi:hypothetical protein